MAQGQMGGIPQRVSGIVEEVGQKLEGGEYYDLVSLLVRYYYLTLSQTFMQKFRNRKYNYLLKISPELLPVKTSPTLLLQSTRTSGYAKFVKAHSEEVTKLVNQDRERSNISHHEGPALFQKRMGLMWQSLEDSDREHWDNLPAEDKADKLDNIYT